MITLAFLIYVFKVSLCLTFFYLLYALAFKRETLYNGNRLYLLLALIVSFIIPQISFNTVLLPDAVPLFDSFNSGISNISYVPEIDLRSANNYGLHLYSIATAIYLIGSSILLFRLLFQLVKIMRIIALGRVVEYSGHKIVMVSINQTPFSFFNWIVINPEKHTSSNFDKIIDHERMHIRSLHSFDNILIEIACVLLWFNPIVFFYKKSLTENNEFMADKKAVSLGHHVNEYMQTIVLEACDFSVNPLVNSFCSITKKRIIMMTKEKSNKKRSLKYLMVLPLLSVLLFAFTDRSTVNTISAFVPDIAPNSDVFSSIEVDYTIPNGKPLPKANMGKISSNYGMTIDPFTKKKRNHTGIDMIAKIGTPIYATGSGEVKKACRSEKGWGIYISIVHNKHFQTNYSHLSKLNVSEGDKVNKGDIIGYTGNTGKSTGPHLHYEIIKDGKPINPLDLLDK